MSKCPFYKTEVRRIENKEIRPTLSKSAPLSFTIHWCSHEDSPLRKNEKGELKCKGDKDKCPIKNQ